MPQPADGHGPASDAEVTALHAGSGPTPASSIAQPAPIAVPTTTAATPATALTSLRMHAPFYEICSPSGDTSGEMSHKNISGREQILFVVGTTAFLVGRAH